MASRFYLLIAAVLGAAGAARSETLLEAGFRQMYYLQFDEAHRTFAGWQATNPADPLGSLIQSTTAPAQPPPNPGEPPAAVASSPGDEAGVGREIRSSI